MQAHVDLFVSEALAAGNALGRIAVVQSTDSIESSRRLAALANGSGYRVEIRGLREGRRVEENVHTSAMVFAAVESRGTTPAVLRRVPWT